MKKTIASIWLLILGAFVAYFALVVTVNLFRRGVIDWTLVWHGVAILGVGAVTCWAVETLLAE